jgi:hypothetical protein
MHGAIAAMSKIVFVTGTLRSGTSLVAKALHVFCGVPMFPSIDKAINGNIGDDWNKDGHFHDADFHALVCEKLRGLSVPNPLWTPDSEFAEKVHLIIEERSASTIFGVKGAHAWIGASILTSLGYPDVMVINTRRPVRESIDSYLARVGDESEWKVGGADFIQTCKTQADEFYEGFGGPKMVFDFNEAFSDPQKSLFAIADFVGAKVDQDFSSWLKPELRRFQ